VEDVVRVGCAPLDALLHELQSIRLLKIDVEGGEARVLDGARETLSRTQNVLIELNGSALASHTSSPRQVVRRLESRAFSQDRVFSYRHAPEFMNVAFSRCSRGSAG
jgi:hypothetical protein